MATLPHITFLCGNHISRSWAEDMIDMVNIRSRLDSADLRGLVDQLEYPLEIRQAKTAQIMREYHEHPDQPILGVESNGELVGFIGIRLEPPDGAVIRHIAVRRDHRGQGIGRQMIIQVCDTYRLGVVLAETDHDAARSASQLRALGRNTQESRDSPANSRGRSNNRLQATRTSLGPEP